MVQTLYWCRKITKITVMVQTSIWRHETAHPDSALGAMHKHAFLETKEPTAYENFGISAFKLCSQPNKTLIYRSPSQIVKNQGCVWYERLVCSAGKIRIRNLRISFGL